MNEALKYFLVILAGALLSSLLGGAFGALVSVISPELVDNLFHIKEEVTIHSYAFTVGMIWGIFMGAAVAGFSCLLTVIHKVGKLYTKGKS